MTPTKLTAALALVSILAAPAAANSLREKAKPAVVAKLIKVTPPRDWNKLTFTPGKHTETWTLDGTQLNDVTFYAGIAPGEPLLREVSKKRKPLPKLTAATLLVEVPELLEGTYRSAKDIGSFTVTASTADRFLGQNGIRFAYEFVDDDNLPQPGALDRLLAADLALRAAGHELTAVAPLRAPEADARTIAEVVETEGVRESPRESISFAGVEAGLFARRLLERVGLRRPRARSRGTDLAYAPYGGLLARADVLRNLGLPRDDFVLYGDDLEYTSRIVARGGRIGHVRDAVVVDPRGERWMPPGFEVRSMFLSTNPALLYYFLRNRVHRELGTGRRWSAARLGNAALFVALCAGCAVVTRRWATMAVIRRAIADATGGRLGRRVEI